MKRISVIDIGSNSIRLVIVDINNEYFKVVDEFKETVRLGKDINKDGSLCSKRMQKAIDTLGFFKKLCDELSVDEIIAVATEAVRKASNREEFIQNVYKKTEINIDIIDGKMEAYYDFLGGINSLNINDCLMIDIGGASTELIEVRNKQIKNSISFPFGALSLAEKFKLSGKGCMINESHLKNYVKEFFTKAPWLKNIRGVPLVGIGGTVRNIAKIHRRKIKYTFDTIHNYQMTPEQVKEIYNFVVCKTISSRKKVKGLSIDRIDIFPNAVSVVNAVMEYCNISEIYVSSKGLRDGILYSYILKDNSIIDDVLDFSLRNLMINYGINIVHAERVWNMCSSLYTQLENLIKAPRDFSKILKVSSLLHDCGITLDYHNHHKHSFYMILNSSLYGLCHKDILISAYIAALHRKQDFALTEPYHKKLIKREELQIIEKLGVLLQISESLDRGLNGNVEQADVLIDENSVTLKLHSKNDSSLEINEALIASDRFKKLFKKKLIIVGD